MPNIYETFNSKVEGKGVLKRKSSHQEEEDNVYYIYLKILCPLKLYTSEEDAQLGSKNSVRPVQNQPNIGTMTLIQAWFVSTLFHVQS